MRLRALAPIGPALALIAPATALAGWSAPATVSSRDAASYSSPELATESGRGLAAWVRVPAGGPRGAGRVQVASRPGASSRWLAPVTLTGPGASAPRVALNARGDAVAAWVRGRVLTAAARRGAEGRWKLSRVTTAGGPVTAIRTAVDRSGRPTLLWSEARSGGFVVRVAARRSARAGWAVRPTRLAAAADSRPALALSASAGALVSWVDAGRARVARTAAGAFERPVLMSSEAAGTPTSALAPGGAVFAAWSTELPGGTAVVLASDRSARTGSWSRPRDMGIGTAPAVALSDDGGAVVAWNLAPAGEPQGIEAATRAGRGAWRATTIVGRRECECALAVADVAIDPEGTALVSWRRDGGDGDARGGASALVRGGSWRAARVGGARLSAPPVVATGGSPGGMAAWAEEGAGVRVATLR